MSDPLLNNTENARLLFQNFSQVSHGFPNLDVVNASLNMVVQAVRQAAPTQNNASAMWDEMVTRAKGLLMDGYDSTGRKKGIYPYTQTLIATKAVFKVTKPK